MVPPDGRIKPRATLTVVVFPAPFGPSRPNTSRGLTTRSTPFRISTLRRRNPTATVLCRSLTSSAGRAGASTSPLELVTWPSRTLIGLHLSIVTRRYLRAAPRGAGRARPSRRRAPMFAASSAQSCARDAEREALTAPNLGLPSLPARSERRCSASHHSSQSGVRILDDTITGMQDGATRERRGHPAPPLPVRACKLDARPYRTTNGLAWSFTQPCSV